MKKQIKHIVKTLIKSPVFIYQNVWNAIELKRNKVQYGTALKIQGRIYIYGQKIQIGNHVRINSSFRANPIGGDGKTILRTNGGQIIIGDNTGLSNSALISYQSIKIGKNVLIGGSCKIYDTDFHSLNIQNRIERPLEDIVSKPIAIEDGVFIGAHTIILKGVTIGENSIVGAGSVVTKSIPSGEIWAGNPAKFIKKVCENG